MLTDLENFWPFQSDLSGVLPTELGLLTNLLTFQFGGDESRLEGSIPSELYNLGQLGKFPASQPCRMVRWHHAHILSSFSTAEHLSARGIGITGTIPTTVGNWRNMTLLAIGRTSMNGTLPTVSNVVRPKPACLD